MWTRGESEELFSIVRGVRSTSKELFFQKHGYQNKPPKFAHEK